MWKTTTKWYEIREQKVWQSSIRRLLQPHVRHLWFEEYFGLWATVRKENKHTHKKTIYRRRTNRRTSMRLILDLLPDSATHHTPQLQCGGLEGRNIAEKVQFYTNIYIFWEKKTTFSWFKKCELQDYYSNTSGQCQTNRPADFKRPKRESHRMVCLIHSLPHSFILTIHSSPSFLSIPAVVYSVEPERQAAGYWVISTFLSHLSTPHESPQLQEKETTVKLAFVSPCLLCAYVAVVARRGPAATRTWEATTVAARRQNQTDIWLNKHDSSSAAK